MVLIVLADQEEESQLGHKIDAKLDKFLLSSQIIQNLPCIFQLNMPNTFWEPPMFELGSGWARVGYATADQFQDTYSNSKTRRSHFAPEKCRVFNNLCP